MAKKKVEVAVEVVFGGDDFLVDRKARELVAVWCPPEQQDTGLEVVDGSAGNAEDVREVLGAASAALFQTGLFGGGEKTVWLKGVNFFGSGGAGRSAAAKEEVKKFGAVLEGGLPEGHRLVISAVGIDKRSGFFKLLKKHAGMTEFDVPDRFGGSVKKAREVAQGLLEERGLRCTQACLDYFLSRTGNETRRIANEVEKLDLYLGEQREFQVVEVRRIVSPSRDSAIWDVTDAVCDGRLSDALELLKALERESPVWVVMDLTRRFRELLVLRECMDRKWLRLSGRKAEWSGDKALDEVLGKLEKDPRGMNPWRVSILAGQARGFSLQALDRCKQCIGDTHELLVSSRIPGSILLQHLLLKLYLLRKRGMR